MEGLSLKLTPELHAWVEREAKRTCRSKSAVVREVLEQHRRRQRGSALETAADLCGCVASRLPDLSHNPKHLKGFARCHQP
jgi:hypothetical protein